MKRIVLVSAALTAALVLTGCSTTVTTITVPENLESTVGQTIDLGVEYTYKNEKASDKEKADAQAKAGVQISSDSPAVTVGEDGTLTAAQGGEATITVTNADGSLSDTCKVTVIVPLTGIAMDDTLELVINGTETAKLTPSPVPAETTESLDGITYTSSDEAIATVDKDGTVTAIADGEAEITATLGEHTATCKVTVTTKATAPEKKPTINNNTSATPNNTVNKPAAVPAPVPAPNPAPAPEPAPAPAPAPAPEPAPICGTCGLPLWSDSLTHGICQFNGNHPAPAPEGSLVGADGNTIIPGGGVFDSPDENNYDTEIPDLSFPG